MPTPHPRPGRPTWPSMVTVENWLLGLGSALAAGRLHVTPLSLLLLRYILPAHGVQATRMLGRAAPGGRLAQ